jgi:hypothetical protein
MPKILNSYFLTLLFFPFLNVFATPPCKENWQVSLDFLAWNANQSASDNWGQIFYDPAVNNNLKILSVPFDINYGLRGSIESQNNSYDILAQYTWFSQTGKNQAQVQAPSEIHSTFQGNLFIGNNMGTGLSGPIYRFAKISWNILFNIADIQLGTHYYPSPNISLKPFIGIKSGSINQTINTYWSEPTTGNFTATEDLKNNFWGIGPSIGINTTWHLFRDLSFIGNASAAVLVGQWNFYDVYNNTEPKKMIVNNPKRNGASTNLSLLLGFQYVYDPFVIKLGYEAQIWFEQYKLTTYNLGLANNHLTLQGITLGIDYKF